MTSEVFYRKWRPRTLAEVVGQDSVTQTLRRAVATGRIAHAYLFCGPRGTGKTSTARILAKAVNCKAPVDGEPDNECGHCNAINEGRALDLIEIDAASNRGIDDIRALSDRIGYAPNEFRYKVYIVDEVHMLTEPAFNALLKTLEEPPSHAIFVLATTEAHKVPPTIISRCQRYDFRRISLDAMLGRLSDLCGREEIEASQETLGILARAATGSLRDAENLLEQAVVSYGSPVSADQVREMLGLGGDEQALKLVECVVTRSVADGLGVISGVAGEGADLRQLQRGVSDFLRSVMLYKTGAGNGLGHSDETARSLRELASKSELPDLLFAIKVFSAADVRWDASSPLPLELALVESSLHDEASAQPAPRAASTAPPTTSSRQPDARPSTPRQAAAPPRPAPPRQTQTAGTPQPRSTAASGPEQPLPSDPAARLEAQWPQILRSLRNAGSRFKLDALLRSSKGFTLDDRKIVVKFAHNSHYNRMREELENPEVTRQLKDVISGAMGAEYEVVTELDAGANGSTLRQAGQSPLVRAAQAMGARIVEQKEDDDA